MSTGIPPKPYFDSINFNPNFFKVVQTYLTEAIANLKYLKLIGGTLTGFLGIGREPRVGLDVNAKAIIDTGINTAPANGEFGSNGTRIILYNGSSTEPPYALGINTNTLWYGTASTGSHRFYTGTNERLVINSFGLVGIGTNDPKSKITINATPVQSPSVFDYSLSPITITHPTPTSTTAINDPKPVLYLCRDGTGGQSYASKATFNLCRYENSGTNSRTRLDIALTNDGYNDINIMSLKSDGGVGIGTTNSGTNKLYVNGTSTFTEQMLLSTSTGNNPIYITSTNTGANNCIQIKNNSTVQTFMGVGGTTLPGGGNYINNGFWECNGGSLILNVNAGSPSVPRLIIKHPDGYVGIATTNPINILQVGSGQRLRISNDSTDYTVIGTSDIGGVNNTNITISGYQRSAQAGNIEYEAVNNHIFYSTNTGTWLIKLKILPDDFQIYTSCSTYGANYYTDGEYLTNMTRTNSAGVAKQGYFCTTSNFYNSLVMLAISHSDTTYSYWHGYLGTNNSTQILYITAFQQSNITIENFVEQGTGDIYVYMRPTSAYNASVQMRIKFYG